MSFLSDIVSKVKNNFSDNKGFFRGNKFTPVTQITGKPLSSYQSPQQLPQFNQPTPVYTPPTPVQFPTLQAPKPSFKTDSATKLNSRLDMIKQFGTSSVDKLKEIGGNMANKIYDDKGFVRQGNIKPFAPLDDAFKNSVKSTIETTPQIFKDNLWNPIKENPVLAPTAQRYENAIPAIKSELGQLNPFNERLSYGQKWDNTKKLGGAALTTAGLLASPSVKLTAMLGGAAINPVIKMVTNKYDNKPLTEGVVDSIPEGAGQGLANAGTTRLTNFLVEKLATTIPLLKPLTDKGIKDGLPVVTDSLKQGITKLLQTGGKRVIKAAVLETAVESPIWATLTQTEQETYLEALQRETIQNLQMNIGMAGVQSLGDSKSLTPIVKQSINTAIENYWKSATTPDAIKNQRGGGDINAEIKLAEDDIKQLESQSPSIPEVKIPEVEKVNKQISDILAKNPEIKVENTPNLGSQTSPDALQTTIPKEVPVKTIPNSKKPITELDWLKENNKKVETTSKIGDILSDRKTEVGKVGDITTLGAEDSRPLPPKSKPFVDYNKQDSEILKSVTKQEVPDTSKSDFNAEQIESEIPKISKAQQLVNIGREKGLTDIEIKEKIGNKYDTSKTNLKTEPQTTKVTTQEPIVSPKTSSEVVEPKKTTINEPKVKPIKELAPETKHFSKPEVDKAIDFETRVIKVEDMANKEGINLTKPITQDILSGKKKVSPELKTEIEKIQAELRQKQIDAGNEGALRDASENHISDVDITRTNTELTSQDNFTDTVLGSTFDATKKNTGAVDNINKAGWADASIAEHRGIMRQTNQSDIITGKVMEENNIPKEKVVEVKKIVDEEINIRKQENVEFDKQLKKGKIKETDNIKFEADKENRINTLSGSNKKRPEWGLSDNKVGSLNTKKSSVDDLLRGEAQFFRDKTPPEVFDALVNLRLIEKGTIEGSYTQALRNFYNVAVKYDYKDKATYDGVNYYLNRRKGVNKLIEGNIRKGIRTVTRILSRSQIAFNAKVALEQPFEVLRLGADNTYGIKKLVKAIKDTFSLSEGKRIVKEYGLETEKSGNVPIKDVLSKTPDKETKSLWKKTLDVIDNIGYKGVAMSENWKNIVFAKAAETEGISKGLKGNDLKSFVEKELIRIAHISDAGMTPRIMDTAGGAGALQYKQYSFKQDVLLLNTLSGDAKLGSKLKQTGKYLVADYTAKAIMAGITGTSLVNFTQWVTSNVPASLGPLLSIPYTMAKNQIGYAMLSDEEKEKTPNPLTGSTADTIKTILTPGGTQLNSKTLRVADIMKTGQSLSKKGNVNYVAGDMNPVQKIQALLFGVNAIPNKKEADKRWNNLKKDGIYPTLTAEQSKVLLSKGTDAEKQAYYDKQMALQTPTKDVVDSRSGKKQTLIDKIFNKNKVDPNASLIPQEGATPQDWTKFKSTIKAFVDSGDISQVKDEELSAYFYKKSNDMPESTDIEKQEKNVQKWKEINSIYGNESLDEEQKSKLLEISGVSTEDAQYYKDASMDNASKREKLKVLANQENRDDVIQSLIMAKRVVGNKYLASSADTDYLYDMGLISKDEKKLIDSWKFDEIKNDFYQDRDYKGGSGSGSSASKTLMNKMESARKALETDLSKSKSSDSSKTIDSLLSMGSKKTTTPKTVGSILQSSRFSKKNVTQNTGNTATLKSVKRQYSFKK